MRQPIYLNKSQFPRLDACALLGWLDACALLDSAREDGAAVHIQDFAGDEARVRCAEK
jgi:hypothetical protein